MKAKFALFPWVLSILLTSCTLVPQAKKSVTLTIQLPARELNALEQINTVAVPPTNVAGFDCYAINIFGPGIPGDLNGEGSTTIPPSNCSYLGIGSPLLIPPQDTVTLSVPSGPGRTVQVIGIATGNGCPTQLVREYLKSLKATYGTGPLPVALIELGKQTVDLFKDTEVQIQNTFVSGTSSTNRFPFQCTGQTAPGNILPLVAAFKGEETDATFGDTLGTSLPPSVLTTIPAADLTALQNPFNGTPVYYSTSTSSKYERLDLVFDTASINLSAFSSVLVEARIVGGTSIYGSGCPSTPTILTGGVKMKLYDSTGGAWTSVQGVHTTSNFTTVSFVPARTPTALAYTENTGTPAGTYMHVSIRSLQTATSGSICSNVGVQFVRVSVVP